MPETITKPHEQEELQDQARGSVQLRQLESLEIVDHVGDKLRMGRRRLKKTWQDAKQLPEGDSGEVDDEMGHVLARDITFNEIVQPAALPAAQSKPETEIKPTQQPPATGTKWPLWLATMLGLAIPGTAGIFMAPWIIQALYPPPAPVEVVEPPPSTEYAPILVPGKPQGVE